MAKYLIDANLPYYFAPWCGDDYRHVFDLNDEWPDAEIWEYARMNRLTIVTKDTDFSDLMLMSDPPPRVIHVKVGNMKLKQFYDFINRNWDDIRTMSDRFKIVRVFQDRIEGIE